MNFILTHPFVCAAVVPVHITSPFTSITTETASATLTEMCKCTATFPSPPAPVFVLLEHFQLEALRHHTSQNEIKERSLPRHGCGGSRFCVFRCHYAKMSQDDYIFVFLSIACIVRAINRSAPNYLNIARTADTQAVKLARVQNEIAVSSATALSLSLCIYCHSTT